MLKVQADPAFISFKKQNEKIIKNSLKCFKKSSLSKFSFEKAKQAKKIFQKINRQSSSIYLFAFGGIGGSSYLFDPFSHKKKSHQKKFYKIDKVNPEFITYLLKKKKPELKKFHFIFISKSGQTPEILFYKKLLQSIYSKNQISLQNKITVLVSDLKSPLAHFAKQEQADIISLQEDLPGRFSVFTLSGFLQLYFQGFNPLAVSAPFFDSFNPIENFLFQQRDKKEYWICSNQALEKFAVWFELVWSESLLKDYKKISLIPSLRCFSLYKIQHAYIEELIAKQKDIAVLFLDFKKESLKKIIQNKGLFPKYRPQFLKYPSSLKDFLGFQDKNWKKTLQLIESRNIPLLNLEIGLTEASLFELIFSFYRTLFLFGDFFKVNIFKNEQVDHLKRKSV